MAPKQSGGHKLPNQRQLLAALFAALTMALSVLGYVQFTDSDADGIPDQIVIPIDKRTTITVDRDAQREHGDEGQTLGVEEHEDLRDEQPVGAPANAVTKVLDELPATGPALPLGGAQQHSCVWKPVRNHSARTAKVTQIVLHVAVVPPNAGKLSIIRRLFDTRSFGASSNIGMEMDGTCEQWVAYDRKPWTQGAFNSVSESVELMARGTEPRAWWLAQPLFKRGILASWVADRLRANGLPPKLVDPAGCDPQAGYTDHLRLECGNDHVDVGTGFPFDVFDRQVKRAYYGGNPIPIACTTKNVEKVLARRYPKLKIVVDGRLGDRSRFAIRRVQRAQRLAVDGIVGPKTGTALGLEGCGAIAAAPGPYALRGAHRKIAD